MSCSEAPLELVGSQSAAQGQCSSAGDGQSEYEPSGCGTEHLSAHRSTFLTPTIQLVCVGLH